MHLHLHANSTFPSFVQFLAHYSADIGRYVAMADKQPAAPPTLSLYDDLLNANPNASISAAPVLYKKEDDDVKSKLAKIQQSLNAG
jgi:hypothetical protein